MATLLVCLSAPLFHHKTSWQTSKTLRIVMSLPKAEAIVSALLSFYLKQVVTSI